MSLKLFFLVKGGWSVWSDWSQCSKDCGSDITKTRSKYCNSPEPQYGGENCTGEDKEIAFCPNITCPGTFIFYFHNIAYSSKAGHACDCSFGAYL